MRTLIVDDEPLARRSLRDLLVAHPALVVVGESANVDGALALTREFRPEVVFLDVQLRGETGFDYLERLDGERPRVVFVTAHESHAIRGFECNATDYLLKPVRPDRLAETVRRLLGPALPPGPPPASGQLVSLKTHGEARLTPWSDLVRISSEGNYTRVLLRDGTSRLVLRTLKDWAARAPAGEYVQAHRTVILRKDWIRSIVVKNGERVLVLQDSTFVPIGRAYWPALRETLGLQPTD